MNYRHAFHAGNHCDVLKHTALSLVFAALARKDKPFFVLDTHAGRGLYDFDSDAASRSGEHLKGITPLWTRWEGSEKGSTETAGQPPFTPFEPYLSAIDAENPFGGLRWYPGSPVLADGAMRARDRLHLCERHPEEYEALKSCLAARRPGHQKTDGKKLRIEQRDGYEAVRALLPPPERRGAVIIDPPFEAPGEFDRLLKALRDGLKRWATGVFFIWYPIKETAACAGFETAAQEIVTDVAAPKMLLSSVSVRAADNERLSGSGVFIVNPPYGVGDALERALPMMTALLAAAPGAAWRLLETDSGGDPASHDVIRDRHETL